MQNLSMRDINWEVVMCGCGSGSERVLVLLSDAEYRTVGAMVGLCVMSRDEDILNDVLKV